MKIGYIRVSTAEQNTVRQEVMMRDLGVSELYIDRASGKNADRTELKRMLAYVRKGDTVIVESISRFVPIVAKWHAGETTAVEAMRRLDMKPSTFYRKVKQV